MLRLVGILVFVCASSSFAQKIEGKVDTVKQPVDSLQNKIGNKAEVEIDTLKAPPDSLVIRKGGKIITVASYAKRYQPRKALLYSYGQINQQF